jgi:hypothetical protein
MSNACLEAGHGDVPADDQMALPPAKAALARVIAAVNSAQEEFDAAQKACR